ncbi:D-2-hydroxyacid dehydrogenase family protein [Acidocella aminolytica]|uniref:D-isomer specific 2-hydroxyacid dehydrogenase n=1 Tax=Acidocella aminolytica 101 = DSM 11237 TaxID=1120923 RepID=A0A0D6PDS6_9PROT|nr:D-2-hydroxyacid dehydrogenase family protein [Acidocella aminolytica]GAN79506.1 D-isomer specific 2-hydroxyacid dehydrogenase [Acidocella aminolytica 101 = DSM 11237]GBQ44300.1 phosphoglycerate dehydrogenase [Acidocella aminolytica 101 = DSM 11237]SHE47482.1 D-3-phosphoglycerate dehydrogenase [Acidocella aminolytica 101 = DSM 11237]
MKIAILDDWFDTLRTLPCFAKLAGHVVTIYTDHVEDEDELARRLAETEAIVLIRERTSIRSSLVDRLPRLRLISQRSVYPHIDIDACTRNGVLVCSNMHADTPSFSTAELAWALILAAVRKIPENAASLRAGKWQAAVGHTLRGKTLGVYGFGRIGAVVAGYGKAFGMDVLIWASEESRKKAVEAGYQVAAGKDAFFADSDVLTLHMRLYPATRAIVTADDLARMKTSALFVNTSRAGLVEKGALEKALRLGRPGSAAVDVFENEPVRDPAHPLLDLSNVTATPHIGYVTYEEWDLQFTDVFDQIFAFDQGHPIHMVNPDAFNRN